MRLLLFIFCFLLYHEKDGLSNFFFGRILIYFLKGDMMKVITIKQPFATLIAEGLKEFEFRTWKTNYRGPIYIHAGKGVNKKAMERYKHLSLEYPSGMIIAKANLTDCVFIGEQERNMLREKNEMIYHSVITNKEWVGYGFKLENIQKIKPIVAKGKLSLWEFDQ